MILPLSAIDVANQPPDVYLWVQDGLTIASGLFWLSAYLLYVRQAYKDLSYGMPILSLCANIAWELMYGLFYPPALAEYLTFLPYFIVDLGLVYTTLKFGRHEWKHSPLVQENLASLLLVGILFMTVAQWSFVGMFIPDVHQASFWSGFTLQNIVSCSAICQLLARGSTRGHTLTIWSMRFLGTLCAVAVFQWRAYYYPKDWGYVYTPAANFLFIAAEVAEVAYPLVYVHARRMQDKEKQM